MMVKTDLKIVSGKVVKIFYYNAENGWTSFLFSVSKQGGKVGSLKSLRCSGIIPNIKKGDIFTLQGNIEDTKYGRQLKVTGFTDENLLTAASEPEEVLAFLQSGCIKGIGKKKAEKIFEVFGAESINIIETDYLKLTKVDGIGPKTAEKIHNNYNLETGIRKIVSALMPYGISANLAFKLYNKWGIQAVNYIKQNPYIMADPELGVEGVGFKRADEIAEKLGIDKHSPLRLQSLIVYLLVHGSMDGNIYYTYEELLKIGADYLTEISADEVIDNLKILKKNKKIVIEDNRIYAMSYYMSEKYNAQKLVVLHQSFLKECVLDFDAIEEKLGNIKYDEGQKKAIETASLDTTGVMVLTGGPGTGKAQPLYSKVLTPTGFVPMGSIKVGDKVISGTGNVSTVLGVYPQGEKDIYELTFDDGSTCRCSDEHLWTVKSNECIQTLELKDIMKDYSQNGYKRYVFSQMNPTETSFESKERYIKDIKYIDKEECQCIYIDDPSHLYITDNYIITHNTTVTKGIIEMFKQSGYKILCAAPTGRAAKRMQEATGYPAFTIHRLLGCKGGDVFEHNQDNPLKCDALIIDEASMIDNNLLYKLLLAVQEGTKLIFIGDTDQLPSIGAGNILGDIITSDFFPVVNLRVVHRQGQESLIISNAHAINEGRNIKIKNTENSDCIFIDIEKMGSNEDVIKRIVSLVTNEIPSKYGYAPKEIQVLVPMKKSAIGVNSINESLQKALNTSPVKVSMKSGEFYVGDKVMQIRNDAKKNVFNGDIGIIEDISNEDKEIVVRYPNTDPTVPDEFFYVTYDFHELDELTLAYACTIHKSQGSEYPAIIMVVSYQHYVMLQRNLIYTGITRAKKLCYILGTEKAIYHASNNVPVMHRNTTLVKRMYEFIDEISQEEAE